MVNKMVNEDKDLGAVNGRRDVEKGKINPT